MNGKWLLGMLLGFSIGLGCHAAGIPVPAPPVLAGALLVVAMTLGYQLADRWLAQRQAHNLANCGGPSGRGREPVPPP